MHPNPELGADLRAFEQEWEQITAVPETPRSTMDVIEYSLGSQRKAEVYVNWLLKYFLDPDEPHGMGSEFLMAFLEGLPGECEFEEDVHDLSDVEVDDQVRVSEVADDTVVSSGIADLVVEVENEWVLVVELKFSAADTQSEFYYRATHVDGRPKSAYESGEYYLYVHQRDEPQANEPEFTNWTWSAFSSDVLQDFLIENAARYPQRTVTQLHEFDDDIRTITGMSDQQQTDEEKVELYLDHYEAIADVTETFDARWDAFTDEWGTRLGEALEADGIGTYSNDSEEVLTIVVGPGGGGDRQWTVRTNSSDWGMFFKDGWWRRTDDLERRIDARPDDRNDVRIGFHHRLGRNRDLAIGDRTLKVSFRNMGANDQEFIDTFSEAFYGREDGIIDTLPPTAEVTGNKGNMLAATYDIEAASHGDFFDAYVAALKEAFVDLVVDNEELIRTIDDAFTASIAREYGESVDGD